jgi:hypothetical protein
MADLLLIIDSKQEGQVTCHQFILGIEKTRLYMTNLKILEMAAGGTIVGLGKCLVSNYGKTNQILELLEKNIFEKSQKQLLSVKSKTSPRKDRGMSSSMLAPDSLRSIFGLEISRCSSIQPDDQDGSPGVNLWVDKKSIFKKKEERQMDQAQKDFWKELRQIQRLSRQENPGLQNKITEEESTIVEDLAQALGLSLAEKPKSPPKFEEKYIKGATVFLDNLKTRKLSELSDPIPEEDTLDIPEIFLDTEETNLWDPTDQSQIKNPLSTRNNGQTIFNGGMSRDPQDLT